MNIGELSGKYAVRELTEEDADIIYELCAGNPMYYEFCPPFVTRESVLDDMTALPPGRTFEDKRYVGFFRENRLAAVMDVVFNYPDSHTAYIGFFMMSRAEQGKGTGTEIVNESFHFIRNQGYRFVRLAYAKGNPQSEAFWKKNGFAKTGAEVDKGDYIAVVMQRSLAE